jgi:hypothetical protein
MAFWVVTLYGLLVDTSGSEWFRVACCLHLLDGGDNGPALPNFPISVLCVLFVCTCTVCV